MSSAPPFLPFTLTRTRDENYRTKTLIFDRPLPASNPGQFVMAWIPGVGEKPFSIASDEPLHLTVVSVGPFSQSLCHLQVGDRLMVRGPLGNGFAVTGKKLLLVGGGYGAVPLLFLAQQASRQACHITVCLGAKVAQELILGDAFQGLGCSVMFATDDGSQGFKGLISHLVAGTISSTSFDQAYLCGSTAMLTHTVRVLTRGNIPCQCSWEALIRCGIGLCGSCELDPAICDLLGIEQGWLVCKDGPVSFSNKP